MEYFSDISTLVVLVLSAFVIGWAAETAQVFMSRALALSLLAWLQTTPEFAVEANIAWNQHRDLMIANLTGSLRLIMGLGWPMVFGVSFISSFFRNRTIVRRIRLGEEDALTIVMLILSILYFALVWFKGSLTWHDSVVLIGIYVSYFVISMRLPAEAPEEGAGDDHDLPWIGKKIVVLAPFRRNLAIFALFSIGGLALYFSVHPFVDAMQRWSVSLGISTFVFVQWVAPFLSEFPEKVTAFQWALREKKAPLAIMNFVNSNLSQWTLLAAMLPLVLGYSLGRYDGIHFTEFQEREILLTVAQALVGAMLLVDLEFSLVDAVLIFVLWITQFIFADTREVVLYLYLLWAGALFLRHLYSYSTAKKVPLVFVGIRATLALAWARKK